MKRQRVKLGNVHQIPLPNGKYAYGRVLKDASIAIYKEISNSPNMIPSTEDYAFIVGVYRDVLTSGEWPIVGRRPFENAEEAWPPPNCIIDSISGEYSVYYKGEIRPGSKEECEDLEVAAVWEAEHIIDRIMGSDKWHKDFKKRGK